MSGKRKSTSQNTASTQTNVDPASQAYINQTRALAGQGANSIMGGPMAPSFYGPTFPTNSGGGISPNYMQTTGGPGGGNAEMFGGPQMQSFGPGGGGTIGGGVAGKPGSGAQAFGPYGNNSFFAGPLASPSELAQPFFNPYQEQVVDATRSDFDRLREGARTGANQAATGAGAFRGARHGVESAVRQSELDRAETSSLANLRNSGFQNAMQQGTQFGLIQNQLMNQRLQEPLFRYQQALGLRNLGMGPTGQRTNIRSYSESEEPSNLFGQLLGGAVTLGGSLINREQR